MGMISSGTARIAAVLVALGVSTACDDGLGPAANLTVYVSVSPDVVLLGDTAGIIGVAHNGASATIDAGVSCAPGIRFFVSDPLGIETDLYSGLAFNCPRLDSQDIEPGETDVVHRTWVPEAVGTYGVRSAVTVRDGPTVSSEPIQVRVIERP
jgi:hypothetical protein